MLSAALIEAGWLTPALAEVFDPRGANLLEELQRSWECGTETARGFARRREALLAWVIRCRVVGAALTRADVLRKRSTAQADFAECLVGWSRGIPNGRRVALVSSRLGRRFHALWYAALRQGCRDLDPARDLLLTSEGTACCAAAGCAADLYGLRQVRIIAPRDQDSVAAWLRRLRRQWPDDAESLGLYESWLSPCWAAGDPLGRTEPTADIPWRDRWLFDACDAVYVLSLRPGGNIERAVRQCLALSPESRPVVWLATGAGLAPERLVDELLESGARAWPIREEVAGGRPLGAERSADRHALPPVIDVPPADGWSYLTHWTRDQHGPWPNESRQEYLAKCVRGDPDCDRSAFAALVHIVQSQQLAASALAIRGGDPVVCFTETPLAELVRRRVFRAHRGHWDFESYGLCIRRSWLEQRGVRPVYYGDDEEWERLPPELRPYFQLRQTRSRAGRRAIDWTVQREWRHRGSLDLRPLTADDALLFVPTRAEALRLAMISRWPIAVVGSAGTKGT